MMKELMEVMKNWTLVKDRLILSVCNANKKGLDGIVHTNIEDLVLIPKVLVSRRPDFTAVAIPKDFCTTYYGVTEEDLILQAKQTAPKNLPLVLKPLESMLIEELGVPEDIVNENKLEDEEDFLILTNTQKVYGAATMFYPNVMETIHATYGDYYIIPSSIHEVLLLKKQEYVQMNESAILRMVQEVNFETVPEEDFLADSLYVYDTGFHKVL